MLITLQWPWWKEFYSFWRELPNYNPICVTTSTPKADHAGQAVAAFHADATGMGAHEDSVPVTNNEGAGASGEDDEPQPQEDEERDELEYANGEMGKEADDEPLLGWEVHYLIYLLIKYLTC